MSKRKYIVMLGTSLYTMGGISAVVNEYRHAGLFNRFPIIYLPTHADGGALKKIGICAAAWLRYMGLLLLGRVALVHAHAASRASFWRKCLFLFPAFALRVQSILHLHGAGFVRFYEEDCGRLKKWIVRYVFNRVDTVVALSDTWACWIRSVAVHASICPINNPVRLPSVVDHAVRETSTILFLGRLGDRKGVYDLLQACARLVNVHPSLKLMLGGDGELDRVRAEAMRLGIGAHVDVLGWVSGSAKESLLRRATVYVLPSYAEGLPMSVLEAMAAGLPIVTTPVGGIPEIVEHDREGCLVSPGDVQALASAIDRLLSDEALRRRMGQSARERALNTFSADCILPQVEVLYRRFEAHA
jgi:glycosyltransferase involved in cell wall biosynthesis